LRILLAALPVLAFAAGIPGWEEQAFRGKASTSYAFVKEGEENVIEASCRASASGLIRRQKIDLARTPFLRWKWKIESTYRGIDEREKAGDDYPARVYVVLDGGLLAWRTRSLVYVWSSTSPAGSDWPSAYTAQAHVVALRSGNPGAWQEERRDVRADFKRYFGVDVATLDGVAIMTDCDDAGGATRAWYQDIRFE
jgi:hypothetical protein